ncbi:hypothetical protein ACOME3_005186 [Neoechinorhynchus agilis]
MSAVNAGAASAINRIGGQANVAMGTAGQSWNGGYGSSVIRSEFPDPSSTTPDPSSTPNFRIHHPLEIPTPTSTPNSGSVIRSEFPDPSSTTPDPSSTPNFRIHHPLEIPTPTSTPNSGSVIYSKFRFNHN